jgi:hypothetical protein
MVIDMRGWLIAAGTMLVSVPVWTQDVPINVLSHAEAAFHHGYTRVGGIRELSDGRVIVVDAMDQTVHVIDAAWETRSQIGRRGSGPREYVETSKIFALPGDSSAVLDLANQRLLLITPDAQPGGFVDPWGALGEHGDPCVVCRYSAAGMMLNTVSDSDGRGYFYTRARPIVSSGGRLQLADSAAIERWRYGSPIRDTVGFVPFSLEPGSHIVRGMVLWPQREIPAFKTSTQWTIAPDGRLAIVHVDPYRVDFVDLAGDRVQGQPIPYERERFTDAHKEQWRKEQQRPRPVMYVRPGGASSVHTETPRPQEPEWPRYLPPVEPGWPKKLLMDKAVHFASDGMLWVQRTTPVGEPPTFDVIDETGQVVEQVKLPHRRRLVGFGAGTIYAVRIDDVDLEYLERYRLP